MSIKKIANELILKNGKIFDPFNDNIFIGDIFIKDGKISDKKYMTKNVEIIDCAEKIITHGFCDLHAHFREPGREDKETLKTGSYAAMAGGFTRVCVMPNTNPPIDSPESISFILKKSEDCPINIHPIGSITKSQNGKDITEMGLMKNEGAVAFSDDGLPIQDGAMMRLALENSKLINVPIINHAEDECLRSNGLMNEGVISNHLGLIGNPDLAESVMIHRDLHLANFSGSKMHIPHVSTRKAINEIKIVKKNNKNITVEVTPHHLYFNETALKSYNTNLKVAPPIRTERDRRALIEAVKAGIIDCIATDHAPHTIEEKETTFDLASFGMIGLESCFGAVNKILVNEGEINLNFLLKLLTVNPRNIMGFDNNLFLEGKIAELTILDPVKKWKFSKKHIFSKSSNSPFIDETLIGKVNYTISNNYIFNSQD